MLQCFGTDPQLSTQVSPVAQLPSHLPHSIPQILINRDPVSHHNFDICLLGDGDTIVNYLCERLQEAHLGEVEENERDARLKKEEEKEKMEWDLETRVPIQSPKKKESTAPDETSNLDHLNGRQEEITPERVSTSHVWLFPGVNKEARWINLVRQAYDEEAIDSEDAESVDAGDQNEAGAIGNGERQEEGTVQGHLELAADLAPGVVAGEGSDREEGDSSEDTESEDGTEEKFFSNVQ